MSITVPNIRTKCGFWNNNTIALLLKSQLKHQTENMSKILNHLTERVVLMQTETSRVAGIPILDRFPWSCIQNTVKGSHPKGPKGPKSREHCREHFRGRSVSSYLYPTPSLYFWNRRQRKGRERGAGIGKNVFLSRVMGRATSLQVLKSLKFFKSITPTILDDVKLRPPLPTFQWWGKWRALGYSASFSLIRGRGGFISCFILSKSLENLNKNLRPPLPHFNDGKNSALWV